MSKTGLYGSVEAYLLEGDDRAKRVTDGLRELMSPPTNQLVPEDAEPSDEDEL